MLKFFPLVGITLNAGIHCKSIHCNAVSSWNFQNMFLVLVLFLWLMKW